METQISHRFISSNCTLILSSAEWRGEEKVRGERVQECVTEGEAEREVNLSVVSERRERGGQQVVGFSPSPPLPHLFIHCWEKFFSFTPSQRPHLPLLSLSLPSPIISHSSHSEKSQSQRALSLCPLLFSLHFFFVGSLSFLVKICKMWARERGIMGVWDLKVHYKKG